MTILPFASLSFEYPWAILLIVPLVLFLAIFVRANIMHIPYLPRFSRFTFILLRTMLFLLVLAALSSPYTHRQTLAQGDPSVVILVDNSSSMQVFDSSAASKLEQQLKDLIEVHHVEIASGDYSPIGDGMLEHMKTGGSFLLVSDGNANLGTSLGDISLHAAKINATINTLQLMPVENDAAVTIIGPDKVSAEVESMFKIRIIATNPEKGRHVIITLDDEAIVDEITKETEFEISRVFMQGYHTLTATIDDIDYFSQNNKYYKVIKVIPKPKVLIVTSNPDAPLVQLSQKMYDVQINPEISAPGESLAIILDDQPAPVLDNSMNILRDFVTEGNGLLVLGGDHAYEKGNYKGSIFESILPVTVGSAEPAGEKINIAITIDISKSTAEAYGRGSAEDVEKALALSAIDNINDQSSVGLVAFNTKPYVVSEITQLGPKRDELVKKVKSLIDLGDTYIPSGLQKAIDMLESAQGGKNILLISDGKSGGFGFSASLVKQANDKGIKVYVIGVGDLRAEKEEEIAKFSLYGEKYLRMMADQGGGIYFRGNEAPQRINIIFGDPKKNTENRKEFPVVILDKYHFITSDLDTSPKVHGYNQALPKSTGKLLATLDSGEPMLAVWRYGLGRIAALMGDDGSAYSSNMYFGEDSLLMTRIINWVIGDPERNVERFVKVEDAHVGEHTFATVKQPAAPQSEGLSFYRTDENIYQASFVPESAGVFKLLGATYAVNYPREFEAVGMNPALPEIAEATGGQVFTSEQVKEIAEAVVRQSKQPVDEKQYYRWVPLLAALILFLLDIFIRKAFENKKRNLAALHR